MLTCVECGKRRPEGQRGGHCAGCCESFTGDTWFDRHRIGDFNDGTRRCMTEDEMLAAGMARKRHGWWGGAEAMPRFWEGGGDGGR